MKRICFACFSLLGLDLFGNIAYENNIVWFYKNCDDGIAITNSVVPLEAKEIIIPDTINGRNVVEIGESAISSPNVRYKGEYDIEYEYSKIEFLKLPKNIKRIKAKAFFERGFSVLEFPETLEELDQFAFGFWNAAGRNSNGTSHTAGAYPVGDLKHVVFFGGRPMVLNELSLKYTSSFISKWDTKNHMFWSGNGLTTVFVGGDYLGQHTDSEPWNFDDLYQSFPSFARGELKVGFYDVKFEREKISVDGAGSIITLTTKGDESVIYYTLNGEDPTTFASDVCYAYTEPLRLYEPCTIKAIAYNKDLPYIKIKAFNCYSGMCELPIVNSRLGTRFSKSNNIITLLCETENAVIRHTTDGSPVTETSPVYTKPFKISETTTVRAKAFKEDWLPSDEVSQTFTRIWYTNETPVISADSVSFTGASQLVTISCDTEAANIYYTLDGSDPSETNGRFYDEPFLIYESLTVKAIAVKEDWKESKIANMTFSKVNSLSAAINMFNYLPETDSERAWNTDGQISHDGISSARSGAISAGETTYLQLTTRGAGRLSFWWKTECETDWDGEYYDFASFKIGGQVVSRLAGKSEWVQFVTNITTTGKHVLRWEYTKDDADSVPPDCVWVDQVQWVPADGSGLTLTTETPVPYDWLINYGLGLNSDFESAAKAYTGKVDGSGKHLTAMDEYVAGTDPTDEKSQFSSSIMFNDGKPIVSWFPDLNEGAGKVGIRIYKVLGKKNLDEEKWVEVLDGLEGNYRFFKVTVDIP